MNEDIIDVLINNFRPDRTLKEVGQDYEALQKMITRERATNPDGSRRLEALRVLFSFQLKVVLDKLVETPDTPASSVISSEK